ncbi:MAG TPA: right-handed parallel beta-helix repeat-containing protein, partial [Thermoplasmata archaeon]|nr:right-handed parallel beta-helix repeat-containing protein [Thermoplasmata archaeon]
MRRASRALPAVTLLVLLSSTLAAPARADPNDDSSGSLAPFPDSVGPQPRPPILIDGDGGFNATNGVIAGNGTASSPYVIANWSIDAASGPAMEVRNTRAVFSVDDCLMTTQDAGTATVFMENVTDAGLRRSSLSNGSDQIVLSLASRIRLMDSTLSGRGNNGARVHDSDSVLFDNVTIRGALMSGVEVVYGSGFTLRGSDLAGIPGFGLYSLFASGLRLESNRVRDGVSGFWVDGGANSTVSGNRFENLTGDALTFAASADLVASSNEVRRADVGIWSLTSELGRSTRNVIENNTVEGTRRGIWLSQAVDSRAANNTVRNASENGILVESSPGTSLAGNRIENARWGFSVRSLGSTRDAFALDIAPTNLIDGRPVFYGLDLHDPIVPAGAGYVGLVNASGNLTAPNVSGQGEGLMIAVSDGFAVSGGNFTSNERGIVVAASSNVTIAGARVEGSHTVGLLVQGGSSSLVRDVDVLDTTFTGVSVEDSELLALDSSRIERSGVVGVSLTGSSSRAEVSGNWIAGNAVGLEVRSRARTNNVSGNAFIGNILHARDDAQGDRWNSTEKGNYWSGFVAVDSDCDGTYDSPYTIPAGSGLVRDERPLVKPVNRSVEPCAPGRPVVLSSAGAVRLQWKPPGWDGDSPVLGYRVLRGEALGELAEIGVSPGRFFNDTSVAMNTTYYYAVQAENAEGVGLASSPTSARTTWVPPAVADLA